MMARVCDRIAAGELIVDAAKAENVNPATVWKWAAADESLGKMYALAKEAAADALAFEALRVARDAMGLDGPGVQAARLNVDTLKWAAARRRPKEYGDKVDVTSGGERLVSAVIALPIEEIPALMVSREDASAPQS